MSEAHGKLSHTLDGHRWKKRSEFFLIRLKMLVKKKALRTFTMKYNFINQPAVLFLTQQPVSTLNVSLKLRVCSYTIVYKFTLMN